MAMRILALDTRSGDTISDIHVLEMNGKQSRRLRLDYVPEICYDRAANEVLVVDTDLGSRLRRRTSYWLKSYDASSWKRKWKQEIPERPMYTGYPGRSSTVDVSPSGRYVYVLQSKMLFRTLVDPDEDDTFRLTVHRYDRATKSFEAGQAVVESCTVAFGHAGASDDEVYFHMSCDYPSTVGFCNFHSAQVDMVKMVDLPRRDHSPRETCGSWWDASRQVLYCVAGDGTVHQATRRPVGSSVLLELELNGEEAIPLRQVHGAGDWLFIGVSADILERSLSIASQIRCISVSRASHVRTLTLPFAALSFISSTDGRLLAAVSPYEQAICLLETETGRVIRVMENVGVSPAEVFFLEGA